MIFKNTGHPVADHDLLGGCIPLQKAIAWHPGPDSLRINGKIQQKIRKWKNSAKKQEKWQNNEGEY